MNIIHPKQVAITCIILLFCLPLLSWGQQKDSNIFSGFDQFAKDYEIPATLHSPATETGIRYLDIDCIRPIGNRTTPYPIKGHQIIINPPTFTWPSVDYKIPSTFPMPLEAKDIDNLLRYDFQLGRTRDFSDPSSILRKELRLALYNHHKALEPGIWYWRYRTSNGKWSDTFEVEIPTTTQRFESPQVDAAYNMISSSHPRIYKGMDRNRTLTADQQTLIRTIQKKAKNALYKTPEQYVVKGKPIPANATETEKSQIEKFLLRYELEALDDDIDNLLSAYLYLNEEDYLKKAITLADHVAEKDGEALYKAADFTGAKSMASLAMTYDVAYHQLSEAQRKKYELFISNVMYWLLAQAIQENVGSSDGLLLAHFFQHTFYYAFTSAIILKDHLPKAKTWFEVLYDIWLSRTPGGGFLADGVWPNGNIGYLHVNMESMVDNFILFRNLFNMNLFTHPWYANCANALAYTWPVGSAGDGFGDGCEKWESTNLIRANFAYILSQELDNPFAARYAYALAGQKSDTPFLFNGTLFANYRLQHTAKKLKKTINDNIPQSAVFPQTGIVVMNTNVAHTDSNLFVSFFSSPFGVGSHGLAEQNSFNIVYKGLPIFYPTGYRVTTRDKHYLLAQKHSRARNTITIDGKTQAFSSRGYGWIARYLDGNDITYSMGDASKAYQAFDSVSAINWITAAKEAGVYKSELGFILSPKDDPKAKLFRRHLTLLRPNIVVVYDELEAEKPVTWTFQLNGLERSNMKIDPTEQMLIADTDNADAIAKVIGSSPVTVSLVDTNYVRPFDWLNPQRGRKAKAFEKHQYHSKVENREKCSKMRFLTIIQIDESNTMTFSKVVPTKEGNYILGDYRIKAQMNIELDARLEIENTATGEYLLYGPTMDEKRVNKRKYSHSTLLINPQAKDGNKFKESIDCHPLMVPGK